MKIKGKRIKSNQMYRKPYQTWKNMIERCYNPKNPYYKNYGAKGIIINIQGSKDLSLSEINSSVAIINDIVDEDANIIFGTVINEDLGDEVIVTVIATGVDEVY